MSPPVVRTLRRYNSLARSTSNTFEIRRGTGFLLGYDGLIITAAHVVSGVLGVTITRGLLRAKVTPVCTDKAADLALLKLDSDDPVAKIIAAREALVRPVRTWMPPQLGERVYAFGIPPSGKCYLTR